MSLEMVLFLLRIISAFLLLSLMLSIFYILWKDYESALSNVQATRRTYGRLVLLQEIDGTYVVVGETFPLLPLTSLGRSPGNSIVIKDTFASSEHAQVALRDGQWWLSDRRSRNGTLLNEMLITRPVIMTHGDVIGIGKKRYRLELE